MKPIIEVENLSKQYRLGRVGTGSLSYDINRWWSHARGKEVDELLPDEGAFLKLPLYGGGK